MTDETISDDGVVQDDISTPREVIDDDEGYPVSFEGAVIAYEVDAEDEAPADEDPVAEDVAEAEEELPPIAPLEYDVLVASTLDGWIGKPDGSLPSRQSADLAQFKRLTTGNVVIMGRKTLESIGHLLPGRLNVIMTSNPILVDAWLDGNGEAVVEERRNGAPQPLIVASFEELQRRLPEHITAEQKVFVIGGDSIYQQAMVELPVHRIWRTCIFTTFPEATPEGGWARFDLPPTAKLITERGPFPADAKNEFQYSFQDYAVPQPETAE